jgi:hypothetical protein
MKHAVDCEVRDLLAGGVDMMKSAAGSVAQRRNRRKGHE